MPEKKQLSEFTDDDFFISGDMARMDEHGRIQIVGREKDLVISGGLNIYPKEIEEAIDALDGVSETAIIGVPHADLGEGLVAVICPKAGFKIEPEAMIPTLKRRLAGFQSTAQNFYCGFVYRETQWGKFKKTCFENNSANAFDP